MKFPDDFGRGRTGVGQRVRVFGLVVWIAVLLPPHRMASAAQSPQPTTTESASRADGLIVFGGGDASAPYEFLDSQGVPQGMNVALATALARIAGKRIEFRLGRPSDAQRELEAGRIDLMNLTYNEARASRIAFLDETWKVRLAVLFPSGRTSYPDSIEGLHEERVAVLEAGGAHAMLMALPINQRPVIVTARDPKGVIKLVQEGRATAVAGNHLVFRTALARVGLASDQEIIVRIASYRLATGKGREGEMAWVGKALAELRQSGEFSRIVEQALAEPIPPRTLREWAAIAASFLAAMLLVAGLFLAWNRSLRTMVHARTREIAEAAAELEVKNAELERFTYTVSHDLKTPLITIRGYLGHLEASAAEGNMVRFGEDAQRIWRATEKMGHLLNDLLELSRVGRVLNAVEDVSMKLVAQDAADLVRGLLSEGGVQLEIPSDLPVVRGDRQRLTEVVQNLIENAVKFRGEQKAPLIHVGFRHGPSGAVFFVRDNGIGIEPRYHEKVFNLFEKLSTDTEGTGVGLALSRRIVEAHGGRMWIESEGLGHGTTFCFTLPGPDPLAN